VPGSEEIGRVHAVAAIPALPVERRGRQLFLAHEGSINLIPGGFVRFSVDTWRFTQSTRPYLPTQRKKSLTGNAGIRGVG
jgi:hypothetical protein